MCCARSRLRTTIATRSARPLSRSKKLKTKAGFTFRYSPAMQYMKSLIDDGFIGTPFIFNGYEQNSQWLDPKTPLRPVDHSGVVARGLRCADHGSRAPLHGKPVRPGCRHDEELHSRARGSSDGND